MSLDLTQAFFEEAGELLSDFEASLLHLEKSPSDLELLNRIFRCAHTLKGNSSMLGFDAVAHFTHALEDLLDQLRKGELPLTPAVVNTLLASADVVKGLIVEARGVVTGDAGQRDEVLQTIQALVRGELLPAIQPERQTPLSLNASEKQTLYEIHFAPRGDIFHRGLDPIQCLRSLSRLGELVQVSADTRALPTLEEMDPEKSYLAWKIWLLSGFSRKEVEAVFDFVGDPGAVTIDAQPMDDGGAEEKAEPSQAANLGFGGETREVKREALESGSIRVSIDKVDKLINLVGELVIVQSMISQAVNNFSVDGLYRLQEAVSDMERNTRELQERVMAVRMLPIGNIFKRFPRLVRDLAATFNKKVSLQIIGEETELDKGMIEHIGDPLTHLIRNAVDHGIDTPEERLQAGKPEQGVIRLRAFHQGGNVIIEIADDGRGLDSERIKQKAVEQRLITARDNLTEEQVHALIFHPGFSTAATISDISGRGVGMDVVRKNVEALKGSVSIASERGRGATFRIRLPLTLAILDGLSLQVGEQIYIIPLVSIVESVRPFRESVQTVLGQGEVVEVRGEFLSLLRLHRLFKTRARATDPSQGLVVIVESEGQKAALLVDELLGQQQVVIKSLEANFQKVEGVSGATIMGDGRVALILDVPGLVALSRASDPLGETSSGARYARDRRGMGQPMDQPDLAV